MPYLPETIESILPQLTDEMEVVVRDNFSTDETLTYLRTITDPRVRIVEGGEPLSAGGNWSAVSALATGVYTKLLCADDTVLPGGLDRQLAAARRHPDAVLIASRRRIIDEKGATVLRHHGLRGLIGERTGVAALTTAVQSGGNPFGEPSSVVFRTAELQQSLPFTEKFPYLTDLDMYAKVLSRGSFVGIATVDASFRISSTSWSAAVGNSQAAEYRAWLNDLATRSVVTLSPAQRVVASAAIAARFLARRVVTTLTSFRG
jgi:GT2 family glycosyltransferase